MYRFAGAHIAADAGVSGELIDKQGNWAVSNERQKVYTAGCVPGLLLSVMAGFPANIGSYSLHRAKHIPCMELQSQIFNSIIAPLDSLLADGNFIFLLYSNRKIHLHQEKLPIKHFSSF